MGAQQFHAAETSGRMEPLATDGLPDNGLVLVDSAPIVYVLEGHSIQSPRFRPLFEAHASGKLRFAVSTITLSEVLTGPLRSGDEALARRYRALLQSWQVVDLDSDIAETAARLRATLRLKLADAVQDDEGGPHDQGVDVKALGHAAGDTSDHAVPPASGETAHPRVGARRGRLLGGVGVIRHGTIVRRGGQSCHRE